MSSFTTPKVIVVGGGLSGLSAAHTVLQNGGRVLVLDKKAFMGGNSTKATSGINGCLTKTQVRLGIQDSVEAFTRDTALSASKGADATPYPLAEVLCGESGPAVEWLIERFGLDLSLVSQLGGHSFQRTHRGKERFPGMTITYALMEKLEEISAQSPHLAQVLVRARVTDFIRDPNTGAVTGVKFVKDGQTFTEHGPVIVATGGYGADFTGNTSLLARHRPDLANYATTNGDHCTGDGIKMSEAIGAGTVDMQYVQVHPTGLVNPKEPDAKVKFLAAEALRGVGGLLLTGDGQRFVDELGRRDYVSGEMQKNKGPFRLVLNGAASREIEWHCKHYTGRGLMQRVEGGDNLAKLFGVSPRRIKDTFEKYNECARTKKCPFGKKFFRNAPWKMDDYFYVGIVTPIVHYTMGGLHIDTDARVMDGANGKPIPGLYATGEVCGGVHGKNRLGGSSLLDCVVFGRVSGRTATNDLLNQLIETSGQGGAAGGSPNSVTITVSWGGQGNASVSAAPNAAAPAAAAPAAAAPAPAAKTELKQYTLDEVAKHNTEGDCWVIVGEQVLDVTSFLNDHPGGKGAIMLFAGKDATEEFDMLHERNVISKYAPQCVIGTIAPQSKL